MKSGPRWLPGRNRSAHEWIMKTSHETQQQVACRSANLEYNLGVLIPVGDFGDGLNRLHSRSSLVTTLASTV